MWASGVWVELDTELDGRPRIGGTRTTQADTVAPKSKVLTSI